MMNKSKERLICEDFLKLKEIVLKNKDKYNLIYKDFLLIKIELNESEAWRNTLPQLGSLIHEVRSQLEVFLKLFLDLLHNKKNTNASLKKLFSDLNGFFKKNSKINGESLKKINQLNPNNSSNEKTYKVWGLFVHGNNVYNDETVELIKKIDIYTFFEFLEIFVNEFENLFRTVDDYHRIKEQLNILYNENDKNKLLSKPKDNNYINKKLIESILNDMSFMKNYYWKSDLKAWKFSRTLISNFGNINSNFNPDKFFIGLNLNVDYWEKNLSKIILNDSIKNIDEVINLYTSSYGEIHYFKEWIKDDNVEFLKLLQFNNWLRRFFNYATNANYITIERKSMTQGYENSIFYIEFLKQIIKNIEDSICEINNSFLVVDYIPWLKNNQLNFYDLNKNYPFGKFGETIDNDLKIKFLEDYYNLIYVFLIYFIKENKFDFSFYESKNQIELNLNKQKSNVNDFIQKVKNLDIDNIKSIKDIDPKILKSLEYQSKNASINNTKIKIFSSTSELLIYDFFLNCFGEENKNKVMIKGELEYIEIIIYLAVFIWKIHPTSIENKNCYITNERIRKIFINDTIKNDLKKIIESEQYIFISNFVYILHKASGDSGKFSTSLNELLTWIYHQINCFYTN